MGVVGLSLSHPDSAIRATREEGALERRLRISKPPGNQWERNSLPVEAQLYQGVEKADQSPAAGHSQAAPRTPLASPWRARVKRVRGVSATPTAKTCALHKCGTLS